MLAGIAVLFLSSKARRVPFRDRHVLSGPPIHPEDQKQPGSVPPVGAIVARSLNSISRPRHMKVTESLKAILSAQEM